MADGKATVEIEMNCPTCKKVMKRVKRYYRNGSFYCNKNCYKKKIAELAEAAAEAPAQ
jgi:hypothetical protein